MMRSSTTLFLYLAMVSIRSTLGEMKLFNSPLPATSSYVRFTTGYLVAPGYIDLSAIKFIAKKNEPSLDSLTLDPIIDDRVGDADDDLNDKGTASPTSTPTVKATASPTAKVTSNPTIGATVEATNASTEVGTEGSGVSEPTEGENTDVDTDAGTEVNPGEDTPGNSSMAGLSSENSTEPTGNGNMADLSSGNSTKPTGNGNMVDLSSGNSTKPTGNGNMVDLSSGNSTKPTGNDINSEGEIETDPVVGDNEDDNNKDGDEDAPDNTINGESMGEETDGESDVPSDTNEDEGGSLFGDSEDESDVPDDANEGEGIGQDTGDESEDYYDDEKEVGTSASGDESGENDDYYDEDGKVNPEVEADDETDDYYEDRRLSGSESVIDVLFFHEPSDCFKTKAGCDWTKLGVGKKDRLGETRWCCSDDAISKGLCSKADFGKMIIDAKLYDRVGEHRPVIIPPTGDYVGAVEWEPKMDTKGGSGNYALVVANCYDYGRSIWVEGPYELKSKGGYLRGDLFQEWHFFIFFTVCYISFFCWFARSMNENKNSTIGIQKWILGTIFLGALELFFKSCDYYAWNKSGLRTNGIMFIWITVGVLKGSISRCVLVMVSLGWGVIRDTLGNQMKIIICLGCGYAVCAFFRDAAEIWYVEDLQKVEEGDAIEKEIYDIFTVLTFVTFIIDVIFYMWILDSLNSTMEYLENMNQSMKLKRYLKLRMILMFSILFGVVWAIFGIVDLMMDDAILGDGQEWIIRSMWVVNYTLVLIFIAILWRPDPRAKEFAYVMELPTLGDDMVLDSNIGSPDDFDDDGVNVSYSDAQQDGRFTIDDGVLS